MGQFNHKRTARLFFWYSHGYLSFFKIRWRMTKITSLKVQSCRESIQNIFDIIGNGQIYRFSFKPSEYPRSPSFKLYLYRYIDKKLGAKSLLTSISSWWRRCWGRFGKAWGMLSWVLAAREISHMARINDKHVTGRGGILWKNYKCKFPRIRGLLI